MHTHQLHSQTSGHTQNQIYDNELETFESSSEDLEQFEPQEHQFEEAKEDSLLFSLKSKNQKKLSSSKSFIQPKLTIRQPNDQYEQEADRMAELVVNRISTGHLNVKRKVKNPTLQPKGHNPSQMDEVPISITQKLAHQRGRGNNLPSKVQTQMEQAFDTDFSEVRVHTHGDAERMNEQLGARAFTYGSDVYFNRGEFQPNSLEGQRLLAHELTHVVQQKEMNTFIQKEDEFFHHGQPLFDLFGEYNLLEKSNLQLETRLKQLHGSDKIVYGLLEVIDDSIEDQIGSLIQNNIKVSIRQHGIIKRFIRFHLQFRERGELSAKNLYFFARNVKYILLVLGQVIAKIENNQLKNTEEHLRTLSLNKVNEFLDLPLIKKGEEERKEDIKKGQLEKTIELIKLEIRKSNAHYRRFYRSRGSFEYPQDLTGQQQSLEAIKIVNIFRQQDLSTMEVHEVLRFFKRQGGRLYESVLLGGKTVNLFLSNNEGGFQEFQSQEEGFMQGLIRGEKESLIANPAESDRWNYIDTLSAVGGFIGGVFQGIGQSLIDNIKGIIELFSPSFWSSIKDLLTDFIPKLIDQPSYRFEIGQIIGQASAEKLREMASSPFETGRFIGFAGGYLITEAVLSLIGLGFVLKAVKAIPFIGKIGEKILESLGRFAKMIGRTGIARKGISISKALAEGINAIRKKIRSIFREISFVSPQGRFLKAVDEMNESEKKIQRLIQEINEVERLGNEALSKGDFEEAGRRINELNEKANKLERDLGEIRPKRQENIETSTGDRLANHNLSSKKMEYITTRRTSTLSNGKKVDIVETSGELGLPNLEETQALRRESSKAQRRVSRGTGDDAGHRIGNRFGGPPDESNLDLQNWIQNQYGTFRKLEIYWEKTLNEDVRVIASVSDYKIKGSNRPYKRVAKWTEIYPDGTTKENILEFANPHTKKSRKSQNIPSRVNNQTNNVIHVDFMNKEVISD